MNLLITNKCNKNCAFCFASEFKKEAKQEMTALDAKMLLFKAENKFSKINILGGEPTENKDFIQIVKATLAYADVSIFSNFLFKENVLKDLDKLTLKEKSRVTFCANATELNENNIKIFKRNFEEIDKKFPNNKVITISITISDLNYDYIEYLKYLRKNIEGINFLRVSIDVRKNNPYFMYNYKLGKKFLDLFRYSLVNSIHAHIDCLIYPCMFKELRDYIFLMNFTKRNNSFCYNPPLDIFPNGKLQYCFPVDKINTTEDKFNNYGEAICHLNEEYDKLMNNGKTCGNCEYFNKICGGPCLAFQGENDEKN